MAELSHLSMLTWTVNQPSSSPVLPSQSADIGVLRGMCLSVCATVCTLRAID